MTQDISTTPEPAAQPSPSLPASVNGLTPFADMIGQLGDQDLGTAIFDMSGTLRRIEALHASETQPLRDRIAIGRAVLQQRIVAAGGHAVPHPDLIIEIEQRTTIQKRIDVLRELEGLVPEPELRPALALVQREPEWFAHAGKLAALARKYGGRIAEVVARGVVKVASGSPVLTITEREPERIATSTPTGDAS
ncbi:MAG: hypothetical protein ACYCX6_00410 [Vulcanimicrobiaceae bacterium]